MNARLFDLLLPRSPRGVVASVLSRGHAPGLLARPGRRQPARPRRGEGVRHRGPAARQEVLPRAATRRRRRRAASTWSGSPRSTDVRKDLKPWQQMIEQLEAGEMPPKEKPQPTADERKQLIAWVAAFLDAEARARAGDPGHVPLRRLSNAEYDYTIRDLTGVDLRPAREFPADGAAGEGFTNAAEALYRHLAGAAHQVPQRRQGHRRPRRAAAGRVPLLAGEDAARLDRRGHRPAARSSTPSYAAGDGRLPVQPYLAATVRHREALTRGKDDARRSRREGEAEREVPRRAVAGADERPPFRSIRPPRRRGW